MNGRERFSEQISPCAHVAELCMMLVGGIRLEILQSLLAASKDVSTLADDLELSVSTVSKNLRVLRENGVVEAHRWKRNLFYAVNGRLEGSLRGPFMRIRIRSQDGEWLVMKVRSDRHGANGLSSVDGHADARRPLLSR